MIVSIQQYQSSKSKFRGDGLRESAGRWRGETLREVGDCPSRLRLSELALRLLLSGEGLLRGLGLRRAGEALSIERLRCGLRYGLRLCLSSS